MQWFKVRASSAAPLFTGEDGLTEKQELRLQELLDRLELSKEDPKKKLTPTMEEELSKLQTIKSSEPELPAGAKTLIERIVKQYVYGYGSVFPGNKETDKGNLCEDKTRELYNIVHMTDLKKCEEILQWGIYTGHPDSIDEENFKIPDFKSSWSKDTFPVTAEDGRNSTYEGQIKLYLYMKLRMTGDDRWINGCVFYGLISTPEQLLNEWDDEQLHYVDDLDISLRYTEVPVELTVSDIAKIERREKMALKYAEKYYNMLMSKNK
jgi:hypothetical protein